MGPGVRPAFPLSVHRGFRITVFKRFKTPEMSLFPALGVTMGEIKGDHPMNFAQCPNYLVCFTRLNQNKPRTFPE